MSDSSASEDLSSDEDEPISLPAPSNFSKQAFTTPPLTSNTKTPTTRNCPISLPNYPHRTLVLLHKWNKYEPIMFCMNNKGIVLCDWSQSTPAVLEEWSHDTIVSISPSLDDSTTFNVEIQRSGFSLRNSVWTFSSTRRPYVIEMLHTFRELEGKPKSVHFEGHLIDTAQNRHSIVIYVTLGSIRICTQGMIRDRELHVPTIDLRRIVTLTDVNEGVLLGCCDASVHERSYVLEFPSERSAIFVKMITTNFEKVSGRHAAAVATSAPTSSAASTATSGLSSSSSLITQQGDLLFATTAATTTSVGGQRTNTGK
tara:strand:- start:111 stop:1049 length:939 start_codon:yes stop_codon:yes gene_type:complete